MMGAPIPPIRNLNHSDEQHLAVLRAWGDRQDLIRRIIIVAVSVALICSGVFYGFMVFDSFVQGWR